MTISTFSWPSGFTSARKNISRTLLNQGGWICTMFFPQVTQLVDTRKHPKSVRIAWVQDIKLLHFTAFFNLLWPLLSAEQIYLYILMNKKCHREAFIITFTIGTTNSFFSSHRSSSVLSYFVQEEWRIIWLSKDKSVYTFPWELQSGQSEMLHTFRNSPLKGICGVARVCTHSVNCVKNKYIELGGEIQTQSSFTLQHTWPVAVWNACEIVYRTWVSDSVTE